MIPLFDFHNFPFLIPEKNIYLLVNEKHFCIDEIGGCYSPQWTNNISTFVITYKIVLETYGPKNGTIIL